MADPLTVATLGRQSASAQQKIKVCLLRKGEICTVLVVLCKKSHINCHKNGKDPGQETGRILLIPTLQRYQQAMAVTPEYVPGFGENKHLTLARSTD